jgi:coenzyme F420-dependent glucose-6-phosphate dehydrogenase
MTADPRIGYSLSTEEHGPSELVGFARRAEEVGFDYLSISDHFHPWIDAQGSSPFVWTVIGGIAEATERIPLGTGVTCPTWRYHPAVVAQMAATAAAMLPGRFTLGVGTGENLNEHVVGACWPAWVDTARLYTLPAEPPPIAVAAGGPRAAELAGRIGDGLVNYSPDPNVVRGFEEAGGTGPRYVQFSVCWAENEAEARATAHRICPNVALQGELGNQLPHPKHYEQAVATVTEDDVAEVIVCGPDPQRHAHGIQKCLDAGYDHVHVYQVGPDQEGFFRFYEREVLPRFR